MEKILEDHPVTPILGRGENRGTGCNQRLLNKLKAGKPTSCIWGCSKKKMGSIRATAFRQSIKIRIRRLPNGTYAIWRK